MNGLENNTKETTTEELKEQAKVLQEILDKRKRIESYAKTSQIAAESIRSLYDAFVNVGFTEDQAYEIVLESIKQNRK